MISKNKLKEKLEINPLIIAITNDKTYELALTSNIEIVFLLQGTISDLRAKVMKLLDRGKIPFVHIDMILGITSSATVVEYIADTFNRKVGIITTKPNLIKIANQENIRVIHRVFMVDSKSKKIFLQNIMGNINPDAVEIMPAQVMKVIKEVKENVPKMTLIAGV
ncbi:MAG: glycerol-3-phosphate responsive antiterminator [Peptoniphilaceae bacterium]